MVPRSSRICCSILRHPKASIRTFSFPQVTIEVEVFDSPSVRSDLQGRVSKKRGRTVPWSFGECFCSPCCIRCPGWLRQGSTAGTILSGCPSSCPWFPLAGDDAERRTTTARCALQPLRRAFWSVFRIYGNTGEDRPRWGVAWNGVRVQRNVWLRRCYDTVEMMNVKMAPFLLYYSHGALYARVCDHLWNQVTRAMMVCIFTMSSCLHTRFWALVCA